MLALGIAASVAVFTLVNGIFLRPFPVPEPDRLVYINETAPKWNLEYVGINYPDFDQWRKGQRLFEAIALARHGDVQPGRRPLGRARAGRADHPRLLRRAADAPAGRPHLHGRRKIARTGTPAVMISEALVARALRRGPGGDWTHAAPRQRAAHDRGRRRGACRLRVPRQRLGAPGRRSGADVSRTTRGPASGASSPVSPSPTPTRTCDGRISPSGTRRTRTASSARSSATCGPS